MASTVAGFCVSSSEHCSLSGNLCQERALALDLTREGVEEEASEVYGSAARSSFYRVLARFVELRVALKTSEVWSNVIFNTRRSCRLCVSPCGNP